MNNKYWYKWVDFANWCKKKQWRSNIMINNKNIFLWYFKTKEGAAIAYDIKAKEIFWDFAFLNFNW